MCFAAEGKGERIVGIRQDDTNRVISMSIGGLLVHKSYPTPFAVCRWAGTLERGGGSTDGVGGHIKS